jgi:hypothetical protein
MEVIKIRITALFNPELVELLNETEKVVTNNNPGPNAIIAAQNTVVGSHAALMTTAMANDPQSAFTDQLVEADHVRDNLIVGIRKVADGHCNNPDSAFADAGEIVFRVFENQGDIIHQDYQSESAVIDAMTKDLLTTPEKLAALNVLGLKKWVEHIYDANKSFKDLLLQQVNEQANDNTPSVTSLRKAAVNDFEKLIKCINGGAAMSGNNSFDKLINEMNALMEKYKQKIAIRKGKQKAAPKNPK